jgi:hypothetical protein
MAASRSTFVLLLCCLNLARAQNFKAGFAACAAEVGANFMTLLHFSIERAHVQRAWHTTTTAL